MTPRLAISIGDVNGIGPEVILKTFGHPETFPPCRPVVFGSLACLEWYAERLGLRVTLKRVTDLQEAQEGVLAVSDDGTAFDAEAVGRPTRQSGAAAFHAFRRAAEAVRNGELDALVTAPVSKEAVTLAGVPFRGHTELLGHMCGQTPVMMLYSGCMRVVLVTTHVPLREVPALITTGNVLRVIRTSARALRSDFGKTNARIAVLALNPHAGDGGVIGWEDEEYILPSVREARAEGIDAEGPFPSDGFFSAYRHADYDVVVAMYHDQGLTPFKMRAGGHGVNVTLGLPIVRTSPDHGTAFAIAGRGEADASSMAEAVRAALEILGNRRHAQGEGER
ncbi:MAG: 4-hydroxythreonine-4-phosphate dehydrogenase PdxA [Bacteroidota bacterium]|nr:4-hydroxythreonine-4-phosphate dehydrogenase PdxA [Bacteroidota bacterium]